MLWANPTLEQLRSFLQPENLQSRRGEDLQCSEMPCWLSVNKQSTVSTFPFLWPWSHGAHYEQSPSSWFEELTPDQSLSSCKLPLPSGQVWFNIRTQILWACLWESSKYNQLLQSDRMNKQTFGAPMAAGLAEIMREDLDHITGSKFTLTACDGLWASPWTAQQGAPLSALQWLKRKWKVSIGRMKWQWEY